MNRKILIVDDSKQWQKFHQNTIEQIYGDFFEMTFASSAKEAWTIAKQNSDNPFLLIISDLQMEEAYYPKTAGEWFVQNISLLKEYKKSKIILISGMSNIETIAKQLNVECVSKHSVVNNPLIMKFMFEKLMPFLTNIKQ